MSFYLSNTAKIELERQLRGQKLTKQERRRLKDAMGVHPEVHTTPLGMEHSFYLPPLDLSSADRHKRKALYESVKEVFGPALKTPPSLHDWSKGAIRTSDYAHPGVLAHELGHAQFYENPVGKVLTDVSHKAHSAAKWAIPAALLGSRAARVAPFAAAAAVAPKLLTEFESTRRGINGLVAAGYGDEIVDEAKGMFGLRGAYGTYALPAGLTVGGAVAAGQIANWLRRLR